MKTKKALFFLLLLLTFLSCRKATVTEIKPFQASSADTTKVLLVESKYPMMKLVAEGATLLRVKDIPELTEQKDSLKTSVHYLPLETREECLIGDIEKLVSDESFIFVFDKSNNVVLRFSQKNGAFLNGYGSKGRGPGEYTRLTDMSIDKKRKEVCLLDQSGFKIIYFNYDGMMLREEPLYYFYNEMEFLGDRLVLNTYFNENIMVPSVNNNRLVIAELNQTPLNVGFAFPEGLTQQFHQDVCRTFTTCNNEIYYNHVLSDTIWQIKENGTCIAKYIFKFPNRDNLFDENDFRQITDEKYKERKKGIPNFGGNIWLLTKDFVYSEFSNCAPLLYCISSGQYRYGYPRYRSFGINGMIPVRHTLNDTSFVRVLQPFQLIQQHKNWIEGMDDFTDSNYWKNLLTEEERQLLSNMTEEDNPILMIMDIEPF